MKKKIDLSKNGSSEMQNMYFEKPDGELINIMDIPPDPDILRLAQQYDKQCLEKKRKQRRRNFTCVAALVLICFVTVSTVSLETVDALRLRLYRIFFDDETGSATLLAEDEYDLIGDWEDYWYPTYLPEGFVLKDAAESEYDKVMLFTSETGCEIRIYECSLDMVMNTDTDSTSVEEVEIGYYHGYILTNDEYDFMTICWLTEDRQLSVEMTNELDKKELIQVAESLTYRE